VLVRAPAAAEKREGVRSAVVSWRALGDAYGAEGHLSQTSSGVMPGVGLILLW